MRRPSAMAVVTLAILLVGALGWANYFRMERGCDGTLVRTALWFECLPPDGNR